MNHTNHKSSSVSEVISISFLNDNVVCIWHHLRKRGRILEMFWKMTRPDGSWSVWLRRETFLAIKHKSDDAVTRSQEKQKKSSKKSKVLTLALSAQHQGDSTRLDSHIWQVITDTCREAIAEVYSDCFQVLRRT